MLPTFPHTQSLHLKESLEMLVVDEADLVFSYGYEDDVKAVLKKGREGGSGSKSNQQSTVRVG